jgi:nicotinamidase-related amidase
MLLSAERSLLLVIDVQERLAAAEHGIEAVVTNIRTLLTAASEMGVPVLASEQYPRGLGLTIPEVSSLLPSGCVVEKVHFSCLAEPGFLDRLDGLGRDQVVIVGIEAHVCVLQTALDLAARGRPCFVVRDASTSRNPANAALGFERMRANGCEIVSTEMVLFEWLHRAATPAFKALSPLIR